MSEQSSADVNEIVETLHTTSQGAGEIVATVDDLRNLADLVPFYGKPDRDNIEGMPSLVGMWVKMFVGIETAFHSTNEVAAETDDTNIIIRSIAKEIAIAVHEYVSAATVNVETTVTTTGETENQVSTTGEGTGTGTGKLS